MQTLTEMFDRVAEENGDRTAVADPGRVVTYAELRRRVAATAEELLAAGVRKGDRVALILPNGSDFVASFFGILNAGAIVVPLNPQYQENEVRHFLEASLASVIITNRDLAPVSHRAISDRVSSLRVIPVEVLTERSRLAGLEFTGGRIGVSPEDPVMHQFSSGSTGLPKRIARTHRNLIFELGALVEIFGVTSEDRFLGVTPFSHVNGLTRTMLTCVRAGASLYTAPRFDRQKVVELIERHRLTIFIGVPFMFGILAKGRFRKRPNFSSLRLCVSASAPMPKKLNKLFFEKFTMYVRQLYGSTETGTVSVNLSPNVGDSLESVGRPVPGVDVMILTESGSPAPNGEAGEIAVKSPAAITGYEKLEDVNREVFRNGFFYTGDLGRWDSSGLLYLVGRKKFSINRGGYKVNPREIEELFESHPKVEEAVVVGVPTEYGDEKIKAVVVLNTTCTEEELVEHCRGKIADFKIPSIIEFRESLPKTRTGKVFRSLLD